jgi:hypothetical protein
VEVPPEGAWVPLSPPGELPALWVAPVGTEAPVSWADPAAQVLADLQEAHRAVADQGLWQVVAPDPADLDLARYLTEVPLAEMGQRWAERAREVAQGLGAPAPVELVPPAAVLELGQALREVSQQVGAQMAALAADLEQAVARVSGPLVAQFRALVQALAADLEQAADLQGALERAGRPGVPLGPDLALADPGELGLAGLAGVLAPRGVEARPEAFLERAAQVLADQEEYQRAAALEQADLEVPHWADLVDSGQADLVGEADQVAFLRQEAGRLANRGQWQPAADPGEAYQAAAAALELAGLVEPGAPALEALEQALEVDRQAQQGVPAQAVDPDPLPAALRRAAALHQGEPYQWGQAGEERLAVSRGLVVRHRVGADPVVCYPPGVELSLGEAYLVDQQVVAHPGLSPAQQAVYRDLLASCRQLENQDQAECPDRASVYRHHLAGLYLGDPRGLLGGLPGV